MNRDSPEWLLFELDYAWREAEAEARLAYAAWSELIGNDGYACFRAAQDRADAAQDALSAAFARLAPDSR